MTKKAIYMLHIGFLERGANGVPIQKDLETLFTSV